MKRLYACLILIVGFYSCKLYSNSDAIYANSESSTFLLSLRPPDGAQYSYDITNQTETVVELESKKVETINKAAVTLIYSVAKDSTGHYLFQIAYDKIQLDTESGDSKTSLDANNAALSLNPAEKMLGALKEAKLTAIITSAGEIKELQGYNELSAQLMANLDTSISNARAIAQKHIDKMIGDGMVKSQLHQLFTLFPDSAIRVGEKWKIDSKHINEFTMDAQTVYQLKAIDGETASIISTSEMTSDNTPIALMGSSMVANLKGTQEASYTMEVKTGMLLKGETSSDIKGTLQLMGREMPIKVKMRVVIEGERKK